MSELRESDPVPPRRSGTGALSGGKVAGKRRRRRKKKKDTGIAGWRIGVVVVAGVAVIVGIGYRVHVTIEQDRQAAIQEAHEREAQFQTNVAGLCGKVGTAQGPQGLTDLYNSLNSIMNTRYRDAFNRKYGPRADRLIAEAMLLLSDSASASSTYEDAVRQKLDLDEQIESERKIIDDMRSKLTNKSFYIMRQFDTASSGKGIYEAMDTSYRRCAVIANEDEVSVGGTQRITLAVKSLGSVPVTVTRSNAFRSFETTEYYPTFETSDEGKEIEEREEALQARRQERDRLLSIARNAEENLLGLFGKFKHLADRLQQVNAPGPGTADGSNL